MLLKKWKAKQKMPKNWRWSTRKCQEANESLGNEEEIS